MENERLWKELKSFPQEVQPEIEKQKKTYEAVMAFYDENAGKEKKKARYNWMAFAAGLVAVVLASFLFLPNLLSQKEEKNIGSKDIVTEKLYPSELKNTKGILISNDKGQRIKSFTDRTELEQITGKFSSASFFSKNNKQLEESIQRPFYLIEFQKENNDLISFQYWPNEKTPNLLDMNTRNWWTVKDLNPILSKIQSTFITLEDVQAIAKGAHPDAKWDYNENAIMLVDKGDVPTAADQVYLARGVTPNEELLTIYIDAVTGEVIREEPAETTFDGIKAAKDFFNHVSLGETETAWSLILSQAKEPPGNTNYELIKKSFNVYYKAHQENISKVVYAKWTPMFGKVPDCMCYFEKAIEMKVVLDDGNSIKFHVIKDDDEHWRLFWSGDGELK